MFGSLTINKARSNTSIVIFIELAKAVDFQGKPPFLSFFVKLQFQSPPIIRDDNSDLSISKLFKFSMNNN